MDRYSTESEAMRDTAREIILDCLVGALQAHNPNWAVIVDDPVITAVKRAIYAAQQAYPAPPDPIAQAVFAVLFGDETN